MRYYNDWMIRRSGIRCENQGPLNKRFRCDKGLCDVCRVFGATGWRRRFDLMIVQYDTRPAWGGDTMLNIRPPERSRGWFLPAGRVGGKEWDKTFGGTDDDCASSVQQTSDGGYVLAGYTKSYGAGGSDFWLIKLGTAANMRGDLNGDNQITPADATIALHLAACGGWGPAADVNRDSHITSLDALATLQAAAGAITL